jgi:hypothetical protein
VQPGLSPGADSHDYVRMTVAEHLEREQAAVAALVVSGLLAPNVQTPRWARRAWGRPSPRSKGSSDVPSRGTWSIVAVSTGARGARPNFKRVGRSRYRLKRALPDKRRGTSTVAAAKAGVSQPFGETLVFVLSERSPVAQRNDRFLVGAASLTRL